MGTLPRLSPSYAGSLQKRKGLKEPDELSIDGLLHDIGKILLVLQYPEEYEKAMNESDQRGLTIYESEKNHFNTTHASVGAWMAQNGVSPLIS